MSETIIVREDMINKLKDLARCRLAQAKAKAAVDSIIDEHVEFADLKVINSLLAATDATTRQAAIALFELTKDKQPVAGLEIKDAKDVELDPVVGYRWALGQLIHDVIGMHALGSGKAEIVEQLMGSATFLTLDVTALKKAALGGLTGLPGKVVIRPQPNIASDLTRFYQLEE